MHPIPVDDLSFFDERYLRPAPGPRVDAVEEEMCMSPIGSFTLACTFSLAAWSFIVAAVLVIV